jgi:hypothetical protein
MKALGLIAALGSLLWLGCAHPDRGREAEPAPRAAVTGSHIPRAGGADSGPSHVKVIYRRTLDQTGAATLDEALSKTTVLLQRSSGRPDVVP